MKTYSEIPAQKKIVNAVDNIPVEYFKWGNYPDHFKIEYPHRHEFAELLFFVQGGGVHEIDYKKYPIESGSVHYIPKSIVHFLKRGQQSDGFTIAFDEGFLEKNDVQKLINPFNSEPFVLNLSQNRFNEILDQTKVILQQTKRANGYFKQKCFLLSLELLFNSLAAEQEHLEKRIPISQNNFLQKFKKKVKANIYKNTSVAWYAQQLNISPKYLGNQIKNDTGISAKQYILEALLFSVKRTLIDTNKSIKEVAIEHNYNDSTLCKLFKKHVGHTMNAYRSYKNVEKEQ